MISERLKEARKRAGFSQQRLAEVMGIHVLTVSAWERGKRKPNGDSVEAIAGALGVSADYLLGRTDDPAGGIIYSDLSDDERILIAHVRRRRNLAAILRAITDVTDDVDKQGIGSVSNSPQDEQGSGGRK